MGQAQTLQSFVCIKVNKVESLEQNLSIVEIISRLASFNMNRLETFP